MNSKYDIVKCTDVKVIISKSLVTFDVQKVKILFLYLQL